MTLNLDETNAHVMTSPWKSGSAKKGAASPPANPSAAARTERCSTAASARWSAAASRGLQ
jgi:hypothetical protein